MSQEHLIVVLTSNYGNESYLIIFEFVFTAVVEIIPSIVIFILYIPIDVKDGLYFVTQNVTPKVYNYIF